MVKLFQRKRRRNSVLLILLLSLITLTGCVTNTPANYTTFSCRGYSTLGEIKPYAVNLYKRSNSSTGYLISNFHNYSYDGYYDIRVEIAENKITITPSPQQLDGQVIKSGSGTVNAAFTEIKLNYVIYNGVNDIEYSVVYSR